VQQALLKIIEGTVAHIPPQGGRKHPHQEFLQLDTTNILFVCGGAFPDLEGIIRKRVTTRDLLGFQGADTAALVETDESLLLRQVAAEDLLDYGLIPEFVGRLPVLTSIDPLDATMLVRILTEPRNALVKQYAKIFDLESVELEFTDDALGAVADQALLRGTGARGLRAILEEVLLNTMYELPSRDDIAKVVIDEQCVLEKVNPTLVPRDARKGGDGDARPRRAAS
ncbi:MAG: AAA family ATPase, partial [Acidimicrobiales bacterium]|nr:AAA family ATPase [Acidimicrobiales bacterium]